MLSRAWYGLIYICYLIIAWILSTAQLVPPSLQHLYWIDIILKVSSLPNMGPLVSIFLLLLLQPKTADAYASQCLIENGCLQPDKCCNDKAKGWPEQYQFCNPEQWGLQCAVCQDTCWAFQAYLSNGTAVTYRPMKYTMPSLELFTASCDIKTTGTTYDEKKLG